MTGSFVRSSRAAWCISGAGVDVLWRAQLAAAVPAGALGGPDPERVRVVLVEMTDKVLAPFDPKLREYAPGALHERVVDVRLGVAVKEVRPDCVMVADGERMLSTATNVIVGDPPVV